MQRSQTQSAYDELLVLAWQQGFEPAGEQLVARWHGRLWRHARLLSDSDDDASEAVQAAWVSMVRGRKGLRDPARFGPWAYRIVTRRCADTVRRRCRSRAADALTLARVEARPDPVDDRAEALLAALRGLAGEDRALLVLVHVDGMPLRYVAEIFGKPIGTVKSRLHTLRERLRGQVELSLARQERID